MHFQYVSRLFTTIPYNGNGGSGIAQSYKLQIDTSAGNRRDQPCIRGSNQCDNRFQYTVKNLPSMAPPAQQSIIFGGKWTHCSLSGLANKIPIARANLLSLSVLVP